MFVTKVRGEWESDSGRQLTLQDVNASELSRVELQALQRVAINQLQSLDIPVSHGLIKGVLFGGILVDQSESYFADSNIVYPQAMFVYIQLQGVLLIKYPDSTNGWNLLIT